MNKDLEYGLVLSRMEDCAVQTLGMLVLADENCETIKDYVTLELAEGDNKKMTRIPAGKYVVRKRYSKKFKNHFILDDVEGRSYILIHKGNTYFDTRGCILVGTDIGEINGDGHPDILNSKTALDELLTYNITSLTVIDPSQDVVNLNS